MWPRSTKILVSCDWRRDGQRQLVIGRVPSIMPESARPRADRSYDERERIQKDLRQGTDPL